MFREELAQIIRQRLRDGLLPALSGTCRIFGGDARAGEACDACGRLFRRSELQYEVELIGDQGERVNILVMHVACHSIWSNAQIEDRAERSKRSARQSPQDSR